MSLTITELARQLNVSKGTVSRVLNKRNDSLISEATRQRVLEAAKELGYRPNRTARALATGRTGLVCLRSPTLFHPFHARVASNLEAGLEHHSYQILINLQRPHVPQSEEDVDFQHWPVDGILAYEDFTFVAKYMTTAASARCPLVSMGAFYARTPEVDFVGIDLAPYAREAMRHLIVQGDRRIAYLVEGLIDLTGDPRYEAYLDEMKNAGLTPEFIFMPEYSRVSARQTVRDYVQSHGCPEAIFCHNDDRAIGAYRGLRDLNIRVPQDVRLIGCDGIEDTEYLDPPVSTIVQPVEEMCRLAWQYLEHRLQEPTCPLQQTVLQARFEVRESSMRPPNT